MVSQAGNQRLAPRRSTENGQSQTAFLKTKMCSFHLLGACSRGSNCRYAHSEQDLNPDSFYRTRFCKSKIRFGKCDNKDCTYAHTKDELRLPTHAEAADDDAEDHALVLVSRMVEELPDDKLEQLLKSQFLRLSTKRREHVRSWLLQQPEQVSSSQHGKRDASLEKRSKLHERPSVQVSAYSSATQEQFVPTREPAWVDMSSWAKEVDACPPPIDMSSWAKEVAACPPSVDVSGWAKEVAACPLSAAADVADNSNVDLSIPLQVAGFEIKNSFVCEVKPKRPELKRQRNTLGCLPEFELSSKTMEKLEEKMLHLSPSSVSTSMFHNSPSSVSNSVSAEHVASPVRTRTK